MSSSSYAFVSCIPSTEEEFRSIAIEIIKRHPIKPISRSHVLEAADTFEQLSTYLRKFATGEIK